MGQKLLPKDSTAIKALGRMIKLDIVQAHTVISNVCGPTQLITLNADIYRIWRTDPQYGRFSNAVVSIDGRPVSWLLGLGGYAHEKLSGSDLISEVKAEIKAIGRPVFILGGAVAVNQNACRNTSRMLDLPVFGFAPDRLDVSTIEEAAKQIRACSAFLILVCLGAPLQERVGDALVQALASNGNCLIVGAGGTADFLSGAVARAPKWIQCIGAEGLYRLWRQPSKKRLMRLLTSFWGLCLLLLDLLTRQVRICIR